MQIRIGKKDGNLNVTLAGNLGEDFGAHVAAAAAKLQGAHIVFDLGGIKSINSVGFRSWLAFLKTLEKASTFEFTNCPPDFVEYCSLLPMTSFAGCLTSIAVPFSCETCRDRQLPVFEVRDLATDQEFDMMICPRCHGTMRSEVDANHYLEFMTSGRT